MYRPKLKIYRYGVISNISVALNTWNNFNLYAEFFFISAELCSEHFRSFVFVYLYFLWRSAGCFFCCCFVVLFICLFVNRHHLHRYHYHCHHYYHRHCHHRYHYHQINNLSIHYLSIISYIDLSTYTFISLLVDLAVLNSVNHSCPYLFL